MKKLLFFLFLLPSLAWAQDTIRVQETDLQALSPGNWKWSFATGSELQVAVQIINAVDAKATAAQAGVTTANSLITQQGAAIKRIETELAGLTVVNRPLLKLISGNYTLTDADNNGTLYANGTAVINCPVLSAGFTCNVFRIGTGAVSFTGAQSRLGYKRISSQFGKVSIDYITNSLPILAGDLTK